MKALAFFGISDLTQIERMSLSEYDLRLKAHKLRYLKEEKMAHLLALRIRDAKAVSSDKKTYLFKNFSDFYDEEARRDEVLGIKSRTANDLLLERARRVRQYRKEKELNG